MKFNGVTDRTFIDCSRKELGNRTKHQNKKRRKLKRKQHIMGNWNGKQQHRITCDALTSQEIAKLQTKSNKRQQALVQYFENARNCVYKRGSDCSQEPDEQEELLNMDFQEFPQELIMYILSFVDRRTLFFGFALCSRQFFAMSKMCHRIFQISPLSPNLFSVEANMVDDDQQQEQQPDAHQITSLKSLIDALCRSKWSHWFTSISFSLPKNVNTAMRYMSVGKDCWNSETSKINRFLFREKVEDQEVSMVLKHCINLTSINLMDCSSVTDKSMKQLGRYGKLKHINLLHTSVTSRGIDSFLLHCAHGNQVNMHLRKIALDTTVGGESIIRLLLKCPALQSLTLYGNPAMNNAILFPKPAEENENALSFTNVKSFTFRGWMLSVDLLMIGLLFPSLETFKLYHSPLRATHLTDFSTIIPTLPTSITKLALSFTYTHFGSVSEVIDHFPFLTSLELFSEIYGLLGSSSKMSQLEEVKISNTLSNTVLPADFVTSVYNLRVLDVSLLSLEKLGQLCRTAKNLESISITHCTIGTKDSVISFVENASQLKHLYSISFKEPEKSKGTNVLLREIANSCALKSKLQKFAITRFDYWDLETVELWFNSLPDWTSLQHLDITGCFSVKIWDTPLQKHIFSLVKVVEDHGSFVIIHSLNNR